MSEKVKCLDCEKEFNSLAKLQYHVKQVHVDKEHLYSHKSEYYDKYLRKSDTDGICLVTGLKTTFIGFTQGYSTYIGNMCHKDPNYLKKMGDAVKDAFAVC
jgi:hypothetical protein